MNEKISEDAKKDLKGVIDELFYADLTSKATVLERKLNLIDTLKKSIDTLNVKVTDLTDDFKKKLTLTLTELQTNIENVIAEKTTDIKDSNKNNIDDLAKNSNSKMDLIREDIAKSLNELNTIKSKLIDAENNWNKKMKIQFIMIVVLILSVLVSLIKLFI